MPFFKRSNSTASAEPTTVFTRHIAHQDWDTVRNVVSTKRGQDELRAELSSLGVDCALHFVCRFHPPIDVVMSLAEVFPGSITQADTAGRYPLHIAAKWGASTKVLRYLTEERPDVAGMQDLAGKTPLHHACASYAINYSSAKNDGRPLKDSLLEIVKGLCAASPVTVNLEDEEDMTALEYAIFADVSLKIVRSIQKACEKDWKRRRTEAPGGNHEAVQQNLLAENQLNSEKLSKELMEMTRLAMGKSASVEPSSSSKLPSMVRRLPIPTGRPRSANSSRAFAA